MEEDLNGRQPKWKTTSMEDDLNGRHPQLKMTSMEDNLNGIRLKWKQPKGKNPSIEEYLIGSQPQWKPHRKQITLACLASQFRTELGPAQPQLLLLIFQNVRNLTKQCKFLYSVNVWFTHSLAVFI